MLDDKFVSKHGDFFLKRGAPLYYIDQYISGHIRLMQIVSWFAEQAVLSPGS